MLPKNLRLEPKEIPELARKGKRFENEYFFVKAWFDDNLDFPKFAISVSIKVSKRAVVRNRIKRKLRASIAEMIAENPSFRRGKYLVIVKSSELRELSNDKIKELLNI